MRIIYPTRLLFIYDLNRRTSTETEQQTLSLVDDILTMYFHWFRFKVHDWFNLRQRDWFNLLPFDWSALSTG